jgi:hypothetical protein
LAEQPEPLMLKAKAKKILNFKNLKNENQKNEPCKHSRQTQQD